MYSLLLRICHTLRSRAREVRDAARDTLAKITVSLGAQYFSFVLKELRSSLTRGYQVVPDMPADSASKYDNFVNVIVLQFLVMTGFNMTIFSFMS